MRQANGVRLGVLGVIAAHPDGLHGYAVRQQWERLFGTLWRVGLSEVYHALGWLAESGWIEEHEIADGGRAASSRKAYRITDEGRDGLSAFLQAPPGETPVPFHRELAIKLLFGVQDLGLERALELVNNQEDFCQDRLRRIAVQRRRLRRMGVDSFAADLMLDGVETIVRAEIAWLDNVCQKLKRRFGAAPI
jgi:DNA-binding PadR family transcriptional regulator